MSEINPGSFRDPSGFVFEREGRVLRQVNRQYQSSYDRLMESGLYAQLVEKGWLISHEEVDPSFALTEDAYRVLAPAVVPFISYPYEWSFSQLRDAALLTLRIQRRALRFDMSLKDCSAYNIQFIGSNPVFIDTLSFEPYQVGRPWAAYRQFCQHFLAPLALMAHRDVRLSQLLRIHLDGVPLDLASKLLPRSTYLRPFLLMHIHLHARAQQRYANTAQWEEENAVAQRRQVGERGMLGLLTTLYKGIQRLEWRAAGTEWADYYEETNYTPEALTHKEQGVARLIDQVGPETVWDLGANTGRFSLLASRESIFTLAFDIDPAAVERNYLRGAAENDGHLLPLVLDLVNPSPGLGWAHQERKSLAERGPADLVLALALVHHLVIANNLPLGHVADFLRAIGEWLIIEFVPKKDSQVQRLLAWREDIFPDYTEHGFETAFGAHFKVVEKVPIAGSRRVLYLMRGI